MVIRQSPSVHSVPPDISSIQLAPYIIISIVLSLCDLVFCVSVLMCVQGNHPEDPRSHSFILLFIFIKSNKPLKMLQVVEEKKINQTPSASKESDCSLFTVCWRQTSKCVLYRCCSMTGQQEARGNSQRRECGKRERGTKLAFFPPCLLYTSDAADEERLV